MPWLGLHSNIRYNFPCRLQCLEPGNFHRTNRERSDLHGRLDSYGKRPHICKNTRRRHFGRRRRHRSFIQSSGQQAFHPFGFFCPGTVRNRNNKRRFLRHGTFGVHGPGGKGRSPHVKLNRRPELQRGMDRLGRNASNRRNVRGKIHSQEPFKQKGNCRIMHKQALP